MITPLIRAFVALVVLCTSVVTLLADRPAARPPNGKGWYVMVLWESGTPIEGKKGQYMKDLQEPDLNGVGGKVLHSKNNRRLIELPVAAAEALRKHKSVAYLQRLWTGEPIEELSEHVTTTRSAVASEEDTTLQWGPKAYAYDESGNIKQFGADNYTYDTAGRLVQATVAGKTQKFKYDAFGNLVEMAVNGASPVAIPVDPSSNRLAGASYDIAGNMVQGRKTYTYDSLNMLIRSGSQQYKLYDVNDEQIAVVTQTSSRWTIRDFGGKVLREFTADASDPDHWDDRAWAWQSDYVYGEGSLVGGESVKFSSYEDDLIQYGGVRHYHLDHLGSVRMVTNNAKRSIIQNEFYPFGVSATPANQEPVNNSDVQIDEMRFAGHQRDYEGYSNVENSDYLDYMHARYYDPNMGRFLSVDPGKDWDPKKPQSWNMYAYVRNNPLNMTDPTGRNAQVTCSTTQSNGTSQTNCTATVAAQIVAGNTTERRAAQQFARDAQAYWNRQTVRGPNGESIKFNVSFDIVAPGKAHPGRDTLTVSRGSGRSNVQMTLDLGMSGPRTPDGGTIYTRDNTGNPSGMRGIAAHETGHLFGLKDLYPPSGVPAFIGGPGHSIMEMAQPDNSADYGSWVLHPVNGNTVISYVP